MTKLLKILESRLKQAKGSEVVLLVRLTEARFALNGVGDLYPNASTLLESLAWIDSLVDCMEQKSQEVER